MFLNLRRHLKWRAAYFNMFLFLIHHHPEASLQPLQCFRFDLLSPQSEEMRCYRPVKTLKQCTSFNTLLFPACRPRLALQETTKPNIHQSVWVMQLGICVIVVLWWGGQLVEGKAWQFGKYTLLSLSYWKLDDTTLLALRSRSQQLVSLV